ncbi:MAG: UDP-N-acetylglucosamine 2-epimerase [Salinispira sp.]
MDKKKIIFLTGTRADFGKIKSLITIAQKSNLFDVHIFVTGMHMIKKYGRTIMEIQKCRFKNIYPFINHDDIDHMDRNLAKTIDGFSHYIAEIKPNLIVVHGDRVEALAGAIVGSLNNILVAHIEGGEISGTIDELIRHSISKLSHIHLVSNQEAEKRLVQMGEYKENIFIIGSPDIDVMKSSALPSLETVKKYYGINYSDYAILIFHPITTEIDKLKEQVSILATSILASQYNYIVIYPNNDMGSDIILEEYKRFHDNPDIRIFPSLRFEYFLVLLKHTQFIIGNSSAGIREAPYYNVPAINLGNRQNNRVKSANIINTGFDSNKINNAINEAFNRERSRVAPNFGSGDSDRKFFELLLKDKFWQISHQKQFKDLG